MIASSTTEKDPPAAPGAAEGVRAGLFRRRVPALVAAGLSAGTLLAGLLPGRHAG